MTLILRDQAREVPLFLPEYEDRHFVALVVVVDIVLGVVHFYCLFFFLFFFFIFFLVLSNILPAELDIRLPFAVHQGA